MRYALRASAKSQDFFRFDVYGQPDEPQTIDYFFFLVRNSARTVLVDCGFDRERAAAKGRFQQTHPLELLARMGVSPQRGVAATERVRRSCLRKMRLFKNETS